MSTETKPEAEKTRFHYLEIDPTEVVHEVPIDLTPSKLATAHLDLEETVADSLHYLKHDQLFLYDARKRIDSIDTKKLNMTSVILEVAEVALRRLAIRPQPEEDKDTKIEAAKQVLDDNGYWIIPNE